MMRNIDNHTIQNGKGMNGVRKPFKETPTKKHCRAIKLNNIILCEAAPPHSTTSSFSSPLTYSSYSRTMRPMFLRRTRANFRSVIEPLYFPTKILLTRSIVALSLSCYKVKTQMKRETQGLYLR